MCQERTKKTKKGSQVKRLREARRVNRLPRQRVPSTSDHEETSSSDIMDQLVIARQQYVYFDLTMRTTALMEKSQEIQDKISALKKETADFVASVMNNPVNRRLNYMESRFYANLQNFRQVQVKTEPST